MIGLFPQKEATRRGDAPVVSMMEGPLGNAIVRGWTHHTSVIFVLLLLLLGLHSAQAADLPRGFETPRGFAPLAPTKIKKRPVKLKPAGVSPVVMFRPPTFHERFGVWTHRLVPVWFPKK